MEVKITNVAWDVLPRGREVFSNLAEAHKSITQQYYRVIGQTQEELAQRREELT